MESAALGSLLSGVLLVLSVVVLIGLCGGCRRSGFRTSIQEHSTDDYIEQDNNQPGFIIIRSPRAALPVSYRSSGNSTHLFPLVSSPLNQTKKRASYIPPTADVLKVPPCNEKYASQHGEYINEDSDEDAEKGEGYIEVLPDPPAPDCGSQQRRVSTASSGGSLPTYVNPAPEHGDYVNEDSDEETEKEGYIEVLPDPPASDCGSQQRRVSTASSDQDNYVNVAEDDCSSDTSSQNYMNVQVDRECHTLFPGVSLENVDSDNNSTSDYVNAIEVQASPRNTRAQFSRSTTSLL